MRRAMYMFGLLTLAASALTIQCALACQRGGSMNGIDCWSSRAFAVPCDDALLIFLLTCAIALGVATVYLWSLLVTRA